MNDQHRRPLGPQPWNVVRDKLDQSIPFANMRDTPYYRDCIWEQFSAGEYKRRYDALRGKMREHKLDAVVVPGGPSHWSFGAGMTWLTGHWEWHALCCYVLVPLIGEPTMIYSMGGTHAEAVRRHVEVAVKDVRHSRNGQYAMVMVERLGQPERAFRAYERVLATRPGDTRAATALIPIYEREERWARLPALYEVLLGQSQGPRFGSFAAIFGLDRTVALIERALKGELAS